jgi:hypothetical protein
MRKAQVLTSIPRSEIMIHLRKLLVMILVTFVSGQIAGAQSDAILQRFLPKAQAGDAQAQYTVGARYYQLHDLNNAKLWLQKSASQGNSQAAGFLNNFLGGGASTPSPSPGMARPGNVGMAGGAGLCPGTGRSLEKDGIVGVLQQASKQMPAGASPKLSMVMLTTQGVCQYTFVLASGEAMTFADIPGGLRAMGSRVAAGATKVVLPNAFTDLPSAIAAAQQQGMQLPLKSAMLVMEGPRGKPPIAVWTLQPKIDRSGRVESYFIAAADGGRPLTLNDVSDVAKDYNAQWQKIIDQFHAAAQAKSGSPVAGGCVSMALAGGVHLTPMYSGHWVYGGPTDANGRPLNPQMFTQRGQQMSPYWTCARNGY